MTDSSPSEIARKILGRNPVYLDTETTGLGQSDEIVEISIIDHDGSVLLNTLIKPTIYISPAVSAIHHITNEMVAHAPTFDKILPDLQRIFNQRTLVIYNAEYDLRMIRQSAAAIHYPQSVTCGAVQSAMELYAEYWGQWSEYRQSYKWQRLGDAMRQQGIQYEGQLHRALADCQVTRLLMHKMAGILNEPSWVRVPDGMVKDVVS
jgi:DNA polymerase III epsilon subunit-like protein